MKINPFVAVQQDFLEFDQVRNSFEWAGIHLKFQELGYGKYTDPAGVPFEGYIAVFWDQDDPEPKEFINSIDIEISDPDEDSISLFSS